MPEIIYDLSQIDTMEFESSDIPELWTHREPRGSFRLTAADIADMPTHSRNDDALRCRLAELLHERFNDSCRDVELCCCIKQDTFCRYLSGKRKVTYSNLAKFCVGALLSEDEAYDLFLLAGYELSCNLKADFILLCELRNEGDIEDYIENIKKYCGADFSSDADNLSRG